MGSGEAPKSEIRKPKEVRNLKSEAPARRFGGRIGSQSASKTRVKSNEDCDSGFGFRTSFGSRLSDLGFLSSRLFGASTTSPFDQR